MSPLQNNGARLASPSPPPSVRPPSVKSPPLTFQKTSNDSLAPLISPGSQQPPHHLDTGIFRPHPRSPSPMRRASPPDAGFEMGLQLIVDQQANALRLLHEAFAAERQAWALEREGMHARIAALETLLKNGEHYSPAKSPVMSPTNDATGSTIITSPSHRPTTSALRLPSIAEDENISPLDKRRVSPPQSAGVSMPTIATYGARKEVPMLLDSEDSWLKVEEIPPSLQFPEEDISPLPSKNRMAAGHTPLRPPRPATPPPRKMSMDGMDDTPTRNNTHVNNFLTQTNDEDNEKELTGPLHMPELPNKPDESNFTFEALAKRLERIEHHPDEGRPMVFAEPSPGLVSPAEPMNEASPKTLVEKMTAGVAEPFTTRTGDLSHVDTTSNPLSPTTAPLSQQRSHELKVHDEFENGGIKLKKKASINFGAPFGQLGGFGGLRKMS